MINDDLLRCSRPSRACRPDIRPITFRAVWDSVHSGQPHGVAGPQYRRRVRRPRPVAYVRQSLVPSVRPRVCLQVTVGAHRVASLLAIRRSNRHQGWPYFPQWSHRPHRLDRFRRSSSSLLHPNCHRHRHLKSSPPRPPDSRPAAFAHAARAHRTPSKWNPAYDRGEPFSPHPFRCRDLHVLSCPHAPLCPSRRSFGMPSLGRSP